MKSLEKVVHEWVDQNGGDIQKVSFHDRTGYEILFNENPAEVHYIGVYPREDSRVILQPGRMPSASCTPEDRDAGPLFVRSYEQIPLALTQLKQFA
jgi:hypothetical protein